MSDTDDDWQPSCYDCGREMPRRNLQYHPVHIDHDEGIGYDRVNVLICHPCRLHRMPTYQCEHCSEEYPDTTSALECCQARRGEPRPDGGST